jgi:hypothetical protein
MLARRDRAYKIFASMPERKSATVRQGRNSRIRVVSLGRVDDTKTIVGSMVITSSLLGAYVGEMISTRISSNQLPHALC